jgi:hypothetical protein
MSSRKVTTNLTTASVIMIGTIATISERNVGMSATTPSMNSRRNRTITHTQLWAKGAVKIERHFFVHLAEITAIDTTLTTVYLKASMVYDVSGNIFLKIYHGFFQ